MGAIMTKALRPIKSFNIENRAHRVISKEKPSPAPTYAQNLEDLKRTLEAEPDIDEKLDKKNEALDVRLRDVYVTSFGKPEDDITREKQEQSKTRPLPQDRKLVEDFDFGFKEPDQVKYGYTTLRKAITFISAHQIDPQEATNEKIALEYKLKEENVASILKYFKTYEVYIPETKTSPALFAGPGMMRKELYKTKTNEIEGKKSTDAVEEADTKQVKVTTPRDGSIGGASVGAASLGARRDAPMSKQAPSVRSDERPLATQGDMLNSIKFQRRLRESLQSDKLTSVISTNKTNTLTNKEKASINHVNSRTSTGMRPSTNQDMNFGRDKAATSRAFSPARPASPKGRRTPSFY